MEERTLYERVKEIFDNNFKSTFGEYCLVYDNKVYIYYDKYKICKTTTNDFLINVILELGNKQHATSIFIDDDNINLFGYIK